MPDSIRIFIADDHPVVRDGLSAMLETQPDFQVVGDASDGVEAVQKVNEMRPDVVLLDLEMPEMDGVEALTLMRDAHADEKVIVFTAFDTDERILGAVKAGAQGYLLKGTPREQVFDAVRVVHGGESLIQPVIISKLLHRISQGTDEPQSVTPRELDVLKLLGRGLQNKEIADELSITERTVKFHVGSILSKMDAGNRTEAVSVAVQRGLIEL